ncbi:MAG: DUF1501 domain-containing protein [Planctomycetes bacterium]|nr:DUF1501 domain-containing protein [Planctomycetota bacterium]
MFRNCGSHPNSASPLSRRDFLRIGGLSIGGLGGLGLPDLLRLQAAGTARQQVRSVIMICLPGGPSHLETYDLKPDAPLDYRGEFRPIATNVPGFDICEHMPLQTRIADKLALVRTVQFVEPMQHELEEVFTGYPKSAKRPSFGSVISKFRGTDGRMPSYVSLEYAEGLVSYESPQYLGMEHRPLNIAGNDFVHNLSMSYGINRTRFDDRRALLATFDDYRRAVDATRDRLMPDPFTNRALDLVSSGRARDAFDLSREDPKLRDRYGKSDDKFIYIGQEANSVWDSQKFLLALRLAEAGVPVITLRAGLWDHHGNVVTSAGSTIWSGMQTMLPLLDRSIAMLVGDLHDRGLDQEVAVLVWGEFGRTPKISQNGRDHWPETSFALFAGGGLKTGQIVGQTDPRGERPTNRPVGPKNVLATLYRLLGIDPEQKVTDFNGRPQYLLDDSRPITELL